MGNEWTNKNTFEILDDLRSMIASIEARPEPYLISIPLPLDQWERVMWYGWWPDLPPALDMWRFGLPATC